MHTVKSTLTMRHNCLALLALRQPSADYLRFAPIRYARPGRRRALFSFSPDVLHVRQGHFGHRALRETLKEIERFL